MQIRHATEQDLPAILPIYDHARAYMRAHHNPTQWSGGYPDRATLLGDIAARNLYVCTDSSGIVGVFCYFFGDDPTYRVIRNGAWLNDRPYGVLHRIAVASHRRGVASACYAFCFANCGNLKVDTHRDNFPMKNSLAKNGFVRCGIIRLASGEERVAFQKASHK